MKTKTILILMLFLAMLPASQAFAHKVIIFAWVEEGTIYTESQFGSKKKARDSAITVVNEKGVVIHKGRTDQDGKYSFKVPENIDSDLILKLAAGTGHKAQWRLLKNELVTIASDKDIQATMKKKEGLEQGPSVLKIMGGIAIIFLLASIARFFKKKKAKND